MELVPPQVDAARRTLWTGLLVFRWVFYAWMVVAATALVMRFDRSPWSDTLSLLGVIATGVWTVWLSVDAHQERRETPYVDLALAVALILVSSLVVPSGQVVESTFYAVAYPSNAALLWGAAKGPVGGLFAGVVLSAALVIGRPLNGVDLASSDAVLSLVNGCVYYLAAGAATGVFSLLFTRWAAEFQRLEGEAIRDRERAAKLAERRALEREIHDSVLHELASIVGRGQRLIDEDAVSTDGLAKLLDHVRRQHRALQALVTREPEEPPEGYVVFGERLERIAADVDELAVTVSVATAAGASVRLPVHHADELAAAVEQALDNVVKHACATQATVFLDVGDDEVIVSIRDNGTGFVYEEAALAAAGKAGILRSMKGRMADLGGRMRIQSRPDLGTEVEFRIPAPREKGVNT